MKKTKTITPTEHKASPVIIEFAETDSVMLVFKTEDGRTFAPQVEVYGNKSSFDYLEMVEVID